MIVALAGRRVDPPDGGSPAFPSSSVDLVRKRIRDVLREVRATSLVASGACGADLLGLEAAGDLGLRLRMVLPWEPGRFRASSVADRPGDWGGLFDRIAGDLTRRGDLIVLSTGEDPAPYDAVNVAILDEAERLATLPAGIPGRSAGTLAVVVWDGRSHGPDDCTASFAAKAVARGLALAELSTLSSGDEAISE